MGRSELKAKVTIKLMSCMYVLWTSRLLDIIADPLSVSYYTALHYYTGFGSLSILQCV